jgi:hypothetical protein
MKNNKTGPIVMFTITVGINGKTIPQFLVYVRNIIDKVSANPLFVDMVPTPVELNTAYTNLAQAQEEALKGAVINTMVRNERYGIMKALVNRLAAYVEWKTDGNALLIAEMGFEVRKSSEPIGSLPAPQNFKAVSNSSGVVRLSCNPVKGARVYVYESTDNITTGPWQVVGQSDTKLKLENMTSGSRLWFRCYAMNTQFSSPVSDVAVTYVL